MTDEFKNNPTYITEEQARALISESLLNYSGLMRVRSGNLQSGNFVTGSAGWSLNALGNLEANSGNFRGDISAATGTFTGSLYIGASNVHLDGANKRIVINDGTNNRIVIGDV